MAIELERQAGFAKNLDECMYYSKRLSDIDSDVDKYFKSIKHRCSSIQNQCRFCTKYKKAADSSCNFKAHLSNIIGLKNLKEQSREIWKLETKFKTPKKAARAFTRLFPAN